MKELTRRSFIGKSALAAAAVPVTGSFLISHANSVRASVVGANERIRLGVIGSGGRSREVLSAFLTNADMDCPVICDVDEQMSAKGVALVEGKRGHRPETVVDFRSVLERKDIDAVLVATPDHWHALPTVYACQAGFDVYVEKPLAKSIDEGRAMLEASKRHNRVVQMGTQYRSGTHYRDAVEFVQSGKLGKVGLVRGWAYLDWLGSVGNPANCHPPANVDYEMWLGPAPEREFNPNRFHFNFRWFWDYAGGLMTDWGVHLINVMMWAMGPDQPKTVYSTGGKLVLQDNSETPDTQIAVYEFPHYTMIWEHKVGCNNGLNGHAWGIAFTGSEGTLLLGDFGWEVIPERKTQSLAAAKHKAGPDSIFPHVRNFLDCVKSRQQPVENLHVGHAVSSVAHLGNISLRTGEKLDWDHQAERITSCKAADELVGVTYRKPWTLPYMRRA
ncbi:Gfo/Idh/MocA family protein [Pedosphaera parvula]|uniref:Oxidoreductase domain protein n=1 Tax=Pedosphaera parvula (strain Ellin514) TaxID=320771 RepID=B9XSR5_PEDPL|nr:Gfo/Idh/MocA family oxidoreductase [Pedosphaera parvula]EEF57117.1 oxidoreductase domain protein [Pedosphaera parvula Ellin514]